MPIPFMVALQVRSRFFRSNVGQFQYHPDSGRQIWRGQTTSDIARLAELVNEGLHFLQVQNLVDHVMEVVPAPDSVQGESGAAEQVSLSPEVAAQLSELEGKLAEVSSGIESKDARIAELELQLASALEKPSEIVAVADALDQADPEPEVEATTPESQPEAAPSEASPASEEASEVQGEQESAQEPTPAQDPKPEKPARRKRQLLTK